MEQHCSNNDRDYNGNINYTCRHWSVQSSRGRKRKKKRRLHSLNTKSINLIVSNEASEIPSPDIFLQHLFWSLLRVDVDWSSVIYYTVSESPVYVSQIKEKKFL